MKPIRFTISPIILRQFSSYTLMGGIATIVDWSVFYIANQLFEIGYRLSLLLALIFGSLTNFTLNKKITFHDTSRQIARQLAVSALVATVSYFMALMIMTLQVDRLKVPPVLARISTTGFMLLINFLINKFITFNPCLYRWIESFVDYPKASHSVRSDAPKRPAPPYSHS